MKKVIIIGSGIAGLATAVRLKSKGYNVEVFEANSFTGGKIHSFNIGHYRFDAGPSLFTLPNLVDDLFLSCNENPRNYFNYKQKAIHCNYFWNDGKTISAFSDKKKYFNEVKNQLDIDPRPLEKYLIKSKIKFDLTKDIFLEKSLHKYKTYLSKNVLKAIISVPQLDLFKSLNEVNEDQLTDKYLVQLYNRYATYNGSNPYETPGIMTLIQHLESHYGTWIPEGGMINIAKSITKLLIDQGVKIHLNSKVDEIMMDNHITNGVKVNGKKYNSDFIISNMDIYYTYNMLLKKYNLPNNLDNIERSSSAIIFYWGVKKSFKQLDLHNIFFSSNYKDEFDAIFQKGTVYKDPTIYVNITSKDVPNDAPADSENWFVMVNSPSDSGQNWESMVGELRKKIISKLNTMLNVNLDNLIEEEKIYTPKIIEETTFSFLGSLYGTSSNSKFSAFIRHPNFHKKVKNLYFCGGSVHPGGGIPLCLMSAKIVSDQFLDLKNEKN